MISVYYECICSTFINSVKAVEQMPLESFGMHNMFIIQANANKLTGQNILLI